MLRVAAIAYGVIMLIGAVLLVASSAHLVLAVYLAVNGALIAGGVLLERSEYRPRLTQGRGEWHATGERFVDPTTNRLIEVRYNPSTGERDYADAETAAPRGEWQPTAERFVDTSTGHPIEVHYNAATGQRRYVDTVAGKDIDRRK